MTNEDPLLNAAMERIDADAVCAACGNVNPDGALICKVCGNNLRDQRMRRVRGEDGAEVVIAEPGRASWVGKGVVAFGLLLLLWTGLNLGRVAEMLAGGPGGGFGDAEALWSGSDGRAYDALLEELEANPISDEESDLAQEQPVFDGTYDGRYVLVAESPAFGYTSSVGQAITRQEGTKLRFVALLTQRDIEVRGEAEFETEARIAARDMAATKIRDRYYRVSGFARANPDGGFECFGLSDHDEESYSVWAYRVP